jgi:hypothetical protein
MPILNRGNSVIPDGSTNWPASTVAVHENIKFEVLDTATSTRSCATRGRSSARAIRVVFIIPTEKSSRRPPHTSVNAMPPIKMFYWTCRDNRSYSPNTPFCFWGDFVLSPQSHVLHLMSGQEPICTFVVSLLSPFQRAGYGRRLSRGG